MKNRRSRRRRAWLGGLVLGVVALLLSSCSAGYVLRSAWYQAEMLGARVPLEKVRRSGRLNARELVALDVIEDVKAFGRELGLSATDNYGSVAVGFNRRIWNVSACAPLSFSPKTWWFPIVGRVPYLGYFTDEQARAAARRLEADGYDVYVGETGAYSTLGWFKDPILPSMLSWGEFDLAETVLHELTHATVWVKGGVPFNESLASFVGEEGAFRYLAARHGADSEAYALARARFEDDERWHLVLHGLSSELDALYSDARLSAASKTEGKAALIGSLEGRIAAEPFHDPAPYERSAREGRWNNARLALFRTYHSSRPLFERLLARNGGDILKFVGRVRELADRGDPVRELERAVSDSALQ